MKWIGPLLAGLVILASVAHAQFMTMGAGGKGGGGGGGSPCSAGQLDFSDGCNTTQYLVILK